MASILITNLGIGKKEDGGYRKATYSFQGKEREDSFVARILAESLKVDSLIMIGTTGSIWDWVYDAFGGQDEHYSLQLYESKEQERTTEASLAPLERQIGTFLGEGSHCHCKLIRYGVNDDDIMANFGDYLSLVDHIQDGDVIYIDITHSFRSLALMSYVMVDYLALVSKKVSIGGIYYGMLDFPGKVKPIVDLSPIYSFGQWSRSISYFKTYGNPRPLAELITKDQENCPALAKEYKYFSTAFSLSYLSAMKDRIPGILENNNSQEQPLFGQLQQELNQALSRITAPTYWGFAFNVARFYHDTYNYGMAYIALQSALESRICDHEGLTEFNFQELYPVYRAKPWAKAFELIRTIKKVRNQIAHFVPGGIKSLESGIQNLKIYITRAEIILQEKWRE